MCYLNTLNTRKEKKDNHNASKGLFTPVQVLGNYVNTFLLLLFNIKYKLLADILIRIQLTITLY